MTDTRPPGDRTPWITAGVLGVIAVVLAVLLLAVIRPDRHRHESAAKKLGLTSAEQQAVDAGAQQVLNLLTYSRKTFDADFARTLAGSTGGLRSDLDKQKPTLLSEITKNKFDLEGTVKNSAFEERDGANYLVLVSADGYVLPDGGTKTLKSTARFELTMAKVSGKWLASNLRSVGLV
jgi:hypothetical protein